MTRLKNILIHSLIWMAYFNLIAWSFSAFEDWEVSMIRASLIVSIHAFLFYLNAEYLMPIFLDKRKISTYALMLIATMGMVFILLTGPIKSILPERDYRAVGQFDKTKKKPSGKRPRIKPRRQKGIVDPRAIGILVSSAAALFVSAVYFNIRNKKTKDEELLQLKNNSLEAEKKFLKSQINPHFLFNTLNNLYSLAMMKSEKTPDAIQQLSEILRYSIYDSENKLVPLQKEFEYIRHYIDLHLLKDDGYDSKVSFDADQVNGQILIPPMLLLPFIENAFKHGNLNAQDAFLRIAIQTTNDRVDFTCENSISNASQAKDKIGGIGMKNVRRRLELFYGTKFDLEIHTSLETFRISLTLNV